MRFKMQPTPDDGLCVGCVHGQVTRFDRGEVTFCNNLMKPFVIQRRVMSCTDFEDRTHETEFEMRKIAWTISTDRRGELGFRPPRKKDD